VDALALAIMMMVPVFMAEGATLSCGVAAVMMRWRI
jgi:hypothetical protein